MVIRQVDKNSWPHLCRQIKIYGRGTPASRQVDIDITCNGVNYILKIQPEQNRKIAALQAVGVYPSHEENGDKQYHLIEKNNMLSALLEIVLFQGVKKR